MTQEFLGRTIPFTAPSGFVYEIREQNGEDEDIISNLGDVKTLNNLTKFIAAIVVKTDFTANQRLTVAQAAELPLLDRYCILFKSRIFSIGKDVEFEYQWPNYSSPLYYTQDLTEMVFEDYSKEPTDEEIERKPNAIPYYPNGKMIVDIPSTLESGKEIMFDLLNGKSESWLGTLTDDKRSRNTELLAHNIRLKVNDKWEKVENFKLFSVNDMKELRSIVRAYDPEFTTETEVINPSTNEIVKYPILYTPNFFFPSER